MLNSMRSSGSNVFVWIIILLLIVALAGFGASQSGGGGSATAVAGVGDEDITVDDYVRAVNLENRRIGAQFGRAFTVEEMRAFGLDQQILSQLLNSAAIDNEATTLGISVGDETVKQALMNNRSFLGPDGTFDVNSYNFALQQANLEPAEYDDILRDETTRELFRQSVIRGVEVGDTAATEILKFMDQRRTLDWVRLDATHLDVPVGTPSDAELIEFHEANAADYTTPETRDITYAYVTEDMLLDEVTVTEDALLALYEERAQEFSAPARRILDRIVFGTIEEAQKAVHDVTLGGSNFDALATERGLTTDDIDLGEVTAEELDEAPRQMIFGTESLGIYGPVETSLGPAVFRVNAVLDATQITLEEARDELHRELAQAEAADLIANETDAIDDLVAGGATIEEVANESILELGKISFNEETDEGIAADQAFREEAVAAAVNEDRDLSNLSDGIFVLRIDAITEPRLQPLEDVKETAIEAWQAAETNTRLTDLATSLKTRIDGGEPIGDIASELNMIVIEEAPLGRNDIVEDTPPAFVREVFNAGQDEAVVVEDGESVLIAMITDIIPAVLAGDESAEQLASIEDQIQASTASDLFTYFTQGLQEQSGISVNQSLISNVLGQLSANGN